MVNRWQLREKLVEFFQEDIGLEDVTTNAIFSSQHTSDVELKAKSDIVFVGENVLIEGLRLLDESTEITLHHRDGDFVKRGEVIATLSGSTRALLSGERVILNLMQRMSGIATAVHRAKEALNDDSIQICDTRKTAPGLRMFDKYAVRKGGGVNHRFGLYDAAMIKDNHIDAAGSITLAVERVKAYASHMTKIEVETRNALEVKEAVEAGADVIMFDNCSPEEIKELVSLVPDTIKTEASGNVTIDNIGSYRGCGVDFISLGSLTHSVEAADIHFVMKG